MYSDQGAGVSLRTVRVRIWAASAVRRVLGRALRRLGEESSTFASSAKVGTAVTFLNLQSVGGAVGADVFETTCACAKYWIARYGYGDETRWGSGEVVNDSANEAEVALKGWRAACMRVVLRNVAGVG